MQITTKLLPGPSDEEPNGLSTLQTSDEASLNDLIMEVTSVLPVKPILGSNQVSIFYRDLKAYSGVQSRPSSPARKTLLVMYNLLEDAFKASLKDKEKKSGVSTPSHSFFKSSSIKDPERVKKSEQLQPMWQANPASTSSQYSTSNTTKHYFANTYPDGHWALKVPDPSDPEFVSILDVSGVRISVMVNPTDARGYRLIVRLIDEDMTTTFNRPYTDEEEAALNTALSLVGSAYSGLGMSVNILSAGNNAQSLLPDGSIQMGNEHEPSMLHGHVIGRGDPNRRYLSNVPLRGPVAGVEFNMRGSGVEPGNDKKIKWDVNEMASVAQSVSKELVSKLEKSKFYQQHVVIEPQSLSPTKQL